MVKTRNIIALAGIGLGGLFLWGYLNKKGIDEGIAGATEFAQGIPGTIWDIASAPARAGFAAGVPIGQAIGEAWGGLFGGTQTTPGLTPAEKQNLKTGQVQVVAPGTSAPLLTSQSTNFTTNAPIPTGSTIYTASTSGAVIAHTLGTAVNVAPEGMAPAYFSTPLGIQQPKPLTEKVSYNQVTIAQIRAAGVKNLTEYSQLYTPTGQRK